MSPAASGVSTNSRHPRSCPAPPPPATVAKPREHQSPHPTPACRSHSGHSPHGTRTASGPSSSISPAIRIRRRASVLLPAPRTIACNASRIRVVRIVDQILAPRQRATSVPALLGRDADHLSHRRCTSAERHSPASRNPTAIAASALEHVVPPGEQSQTGRRHARRTLFKAELLLPARTESLPLQSVAPNLRSARRSASALVPYKTAPSSPTLAELPQPVHRPHSGMPMPSCGKASTSSRLGARYAFNPIGKELRMSHARHSLTTPQSGSAILRQRSDLARAWFMPISTTATSCSGSNLSSSCRRHAEVIVQVPLRLQHLELREPAPAPRTPSSSSSPPTRHANHSLAPGPPHRDAPALLHGVPAHSPGLHPERSNPCLIHTRRLPASASLTTAATAPLPNSRLQHNRAHVNTLARGPQRTDRLFAPMCANRSNTPSFLARVQLTLASNPQSPQRQLHHPSASSCHMGAPSFRPKVGYRLLHRTPHLPISQTPFRLRHIIKRHRPIRKRLRLLMPLARQQHNVSRTRAA